jgi:hypothetical protein
MRGYACHHFYCSIFNIKLVLERREYRLTYDELSTTDRQGKLEDAGVMTDVYSTQPRMYVASRQSVDLPFFNSPLHPHCCIARYRIAWMWTSKPARDRSMIQTATQFSTLSNNILTGAASSREVVLIFSIVYDASSLLQ